MKSAVCLWIASIVKVRVLLSPDSDERTSYRPAGRLTGIWLLIRITRYLNYPNYPLRSVSDTDSRVRFGGPGLGVPNASEICVRSVADQKHQAVLFRRSPSGPTWATRFESSGSGCRFADRGETNERGLWPVTCYCDRHSGSPGLICKHTTTTYRIHIHMSAYRGLLTMHTFAFNATQPPVLIQVIDSNITGKRLQLANAITISESLKKQHT